ncbi:MAG: Asp-tRNA(Asn)/Glu-tRNA(Gln) amidotransferase subunit GatC [Myxococcota bacterium]
MREPKITLEEVQRVAKLARMKLSEDELNEMQAQLDSILGYIAELDALDVTDVEPTFHSVPIDAPLRADIPEPCSDRAELLAEAPQSEAGGFAVPLVLEVDS